MPTRSSRSRASRRYIRFRPVRPRGDGVSHEPLQAFPSELTPVSPSCPCPLRAENDEAETVKDLEHWGYDPVTLEPVAKSAGGAEEVSESQAKTTAP